MNYSKYPGYHLYRSTHACYITDTTFNLKKRINYNRDPATVSCSGNVKMKVAPIRRGRRTVCLH